jgi:hypothetical protein
MATYTTNNNIRALLGAACLDDAHREMLLTDWRALAVALGVTVTEAEAVGLDMLSTEPFQKLEESFRTIGNTLKDIGCPEWPECPQERAQP